MPPRFETPAPTPHLHTHTRDEPAVPRTPRASCSDVQPSGTPSTTPCGPVHTSPSIIRQPSRTPRTPGPGPGTSMTACSSSADAFTTVKVHTAKCSECDKRNMDTMRRCPGCTFQVCKPCYDRREKSGKTLAHGNMLSPAVAAPRGAGGSVVRKRPGGAVGKETGSESKERKMKDGQGPVKLKLLLKSPTGKKRSGKQQAKPKESDVEESSADDFTPDSPTARKRRRVAPTPSSVAAPTPRVTRKPLPAVVVNGDVGTITTKTITENQRRPSLDELLQLHGVHTSEDPYREHLLSRHTPVTMNPVIHLPDNVKRAFKPRPTALEIQQNIQDKVRQKIKVLENKSARTVRSFVEEAAVTYEQSISLDKDERDEFVSALKEVARKWAIQTYNDMAMAGHTDVVRGLDLQISTIGLERRAMLENIVAECAARKLRELARESELGQDVLQTIA